MNALSPEFSRRLTRLGPADRVRVVVFLEQADAVRFREQPDAVGEPGRRQNAAQRAAAVRAIQLPGSSRLKDLERVLASFGGQTFGTGVSALGSIPVETTVSGVKALAALPQVKAVIEDQAVVGVPPRAARP